MKVCEKCGIEISTKDGENQCTKCEMRKLKRDKARKLVKARDSAMESLGLVKVRGAMGGVYWE